MSGSYIGNLPSLEFENLNQSSHLSSAEFLHKSLGHVSYHRLRKKLGIPLKIVNNCESCAVSKITKASFKSTHKSASKPFEEIHLDLMGPIWPPSHQGHRFILTLVDSCTRFCAAIPIKLKSDVADTIPFLKTLELIGDTGMKSPNYFYPVGNRVSFLIQPEQSFSKLKPKGKLGRLIGYTDELRSYRILSDEGKIFETKNLKMKLFRNHSLKRQEEMKLKYLLKKRNCRRRMIMRKWPQVSSQRTSGF
ncbi:hypothetical protein VP01_1707g1 [Puccinia sorghi]|uniref:Integrase catalytic domain-containing protein n=1 Tax=Puccinia sorghi TaxID=27349 RepID=A0A0L6VG65_9BASI|nr:hypothetical protein VP01_1707g1 [Puccinia sorghi]